MVGKSFKLLWFVRTIVQSTVTKRPLHVSLGDDSNTQVVFNSRMSVRWGKHHISFSGLTLDT